MKVTEEDVDLYNNVYVDYMRSKRRLGSVDERVEAITQAIDIQYDRNDAPLSKLKYRAAEVKEDFTSLINSRTRHRCSMNNVPLLNYGGEGEPLVGAIERRGRSSLVPFRLSFGSISNSAMSEKAQRRSDMLKDFGTLNRESNMFKNSNLDFG